MKPRVAGASGPFVYDDAGKEYVNLAESTNVFGHRNPEIYTKINQYLSKELIHYPLTISRPNIAEEVTQKILGLSGIEGGNAVFSSSGSEACDIALSVLSDFGPVMTLEGGYHGNSGQFLNKRSTDLMRHHQSFEIPFPVSGNFVESVERCIDRGARSILMEVLQVEAGIREIYRGFTTYLRKEHPDVAICVDESYTGVGKTGKFFSYQWLDFVPDMVVIGKAIGGGLPLGITLLSKELFLKSQTVKIFRNGAYGSSSGNILSLNLAGDMIDMVSSGSFMGDVVEKGRLITRELSGKFGKRLVGQGLIRGIVCRNRGDLAINLEKLQDAGIFATGMGDTIRISPPLNIPENLLKDVCKKIKKIVDLG